MLSERNLETVLDALAEQIRNLTLDLRCRENEVGIYKNKCKDLETENAELYKLFAEKGITNGTH